jgi:predicted phage terminase large subunit-like protein
MRLPACLWELSGDQNQKERYENTEGGWRIISSVESGTTGEGGDYVTVDDAHDAAKVESDLERSAAHEWWFRVMSTRLDHPKTGRKLAIMQRTHVDDVAGAIKERGGYEVIELKTLYECDAPGRRTVQALGLEDPRTDEGELLCEAHFGHAEVQQAQKDLGTQGFAAQHQQSPVPREGGIIKREWLRRWSILPAKFDYTFHSWDLKFGGKTREQLMRLKNPSWVHGAWFGKKGASLYLVGERRARVGFLESIGLISAMVEDDPGARKIIVEDKADGPATIEVLQGEIANVVAWDPRRASKIQRAETAAPFIEGGGLYVPSDAHGEWVEEWIEEVTTFPFARDADRVDTLTQAVLSECRAQDQTAIKKMKALARF